MNQYGFVRITCVSPRTAVANPAANAAEIMRVLDQVADSDIVLFPELCVTGYTCADLFGQSALLDAGIRATLRIAQATAGRAQLVVVGAPIPVGNSLFNCAVVISDGSILGIVPKQYIPNYKEFYESRWFSPAVGTVPPRSSSAASASPSASICCSRRKSGERRSRNGGVVVGIEICEDLWVPVPPSCAPGDGRGDGLAQPVGQQRDDRQEPVPHRPGRGPVGPVRSPPMRWPAAGRRNRRPTWSSAAIA